MVLELKKIIGLFLFYGAILAYSSSFDSTVSKIEVYYITCNSDYPGVISPEEFNNYDRRLLKRDILTLDNCDILLKEIKSKDGLKCDSTYSKVYNGNPPNVRILVVIYFSDTSRLDYYLDSSGGIFYNGVYYLENKIISNFLCSEVRDFDCFCSGFRGFK